MSGTIHNPIHGLYIKQAFGKSLYKGEDAWLQQPGLSWKPSSNHQGEPWLFLLFSKALTIATILTNRYFFLQIAVSTMTCLVSLTGMVASRLQHLRQSMCCRFSSKS